jgi:hypothetical protein
MTMNLTRYKTFLYYVHNLNLIVCVGLGHYPANELNFYPEITLMWRYPKDH